MTPQTHIFMFRSIIDLQNEVGNGNVLKGKERDTCLQVNFDGIGRAIFRNKFFPNSRHQKLTEENATTFDETDPMHQVNVKKTEGEGNEFEWDCDEVEAANYADDHTYSQILADEPLSPGVCDNFTNVDL